MTTMNRWVSNLRKTLKNQAPLLAKPFGLTLLSKAQTEACLRPSRLAFSRGETVTLPRTGDFTNDGKTIFAETTVTTATAQVWSINNQNQKIAQLPNGSLRVGRQVLDTDFGTSALFKDLFVARKRAVVNTDTLIAPWSHYWGGYYDYLFFVAAKLCRIKDILPKTEFAEAMVAYPLLHTAFERELLDCIGVRPENRIDTRTHAVRFSQGILGNNDSWFYPNKADLESVKKHIRTGSPLPNDTPKPMPGRIYVSRSGRRRVLNEDALVRLLERYDFFILADEPRSLAEQMALYGNAQFVIGPHGASFANVLWCRPGTQLLELFAPNYVPDYFRYLAHRLGLRHSAYCDGPVENNHFSHVNADVFVALDPFEKRLNQLLKTNQSALTP